MRTAIALVITMTLTASVLYGQNAEQPSPTTAEEQPEVLTPGPCARGLC